MGLSNREIAILFWAVIVLLYMLRKGINKDTATSLIFLLKSLFHIKVQAILWGGIIWVSLCVFLLKEAGVWTLPNLKTTLIWGCTFAFISTINAHKIGETNSYFKDELGGIVNATVIMTFITEAYSFSIFTEITITPIIALLVTLQTMSERDPRHARVQKLSTIILAIAGLAYTINALYMIIQDLSGFASMDNLREFLTPAILTCIYLLYIYIINVYIAYDTLSIGLTHVITHPKLRKHAVLKAAWAFKTNLKCLHLWKINVGIFRPGCKNEVNASIKEIKSQIYRERNPIPITVDQGWLPTKAASFLANKELRVNHYIRTYEDEYWGDAHIFKIESSRLNRDSIAYVIRGNDTAVKRLKLEVTINNKDFHSIPESLFTDIGSELVAQSITCGEIDLRHAVNADSDIDIVIDSRRVRLLRENYKHNKTGGYFRTLIIDHHPLYRTSED